MEKNLEELTVKELKKLAENKGIEITASKKAEIIEEINNAEDAVSEEVVQAVAEAIDKEAKEQNKTADDVIREIKEESETAEESEEQEETAEESEEQEETAEESEEQEETAEEQEEDCEWSVGVEEDGNVHVRPVKKEIEVPEGFTKKTNLNKKEYGYHNGRKYLKLKNGYGMWADNGTAFVINELK